MSEQGNFDFSKNDDPELSKILRGFTNERDQYYNWLEAKVHKDRNVLTYNREAADRAIHLSTVFAKVAMGIDQYFQNRELTRKHISRIWFADETFRADYFTMLAPGIEFTPLSKLYIDQRVAHYQKQADLSPNDFQNDIREEYGDALAADVAGLVKATFIRQDTALITRLPHLKLSTPESTHMALSASAAKELCADAGRLLLDSVIDGNFVRYMHRQ